MVPLGAILRLRALRAGRRRLDEAVATAVAAVVTLVPEGLILLASLTYAVAALRMARRGALAQQLNAIESLASAEVICLDKTGTLTEAASPRRRGAAPRPGSRKGGSRHALGRYAASSPGGNATLEAIAAPSPGTRRAGRRPRSVLLAAALERPARWARRATCSARPELFPLGALAERARAASSGRVGGSSPSERRARSPASPCTAIRRAPPRAWSRSASSSSPSDLRPDARETVEFFRAEGVELKVISGDAPETVARDRRRRGHPARPARRSTARAPGPKAPRCARWRRTTTVIGRISPEGKRRVIEALRDAGRYVAMVGDGVNDVPALKAARLAIAQGSGSADGQAASPTSSSSAATSPRCPRWSREGRKVLRNLQRVTKLFVTKSAFAAFLILTVGRSPSRSTRSCRAI